MDFIFPFLIVFGIVAVGGYGFYKHAVKHTDGTDDIQTADSGQKGLMSSAHVTDIDAAEAAIDAAEAAIVTAQAAIVAAEGEIEAARGSKVSVDARLDVSLNEDGSLKADVGDHYVDRGDPGAWDFTQVTLTTDETWRDLDLSAIVPAGAVAVCLRVGVNDDAVGSILQFRKNGNTNEINTSTVRTQVVNVMHNADIIVFVDGGRVIEYWGSNLAFVGIWLTVKGWWIA